MENVDRAQKSNAYSFAKDIFKSAGYGLTEIVLDASLCGVPQKRKRFFCIGILNGKDNALRSLIELRMSKHPTTLRDYYGDSLDFEFYYRHPRNYSRRGIFSIDEPAPTMRGVNRPVPKGYLGHPNDACPLNDSVRALTTEERALVQTFPSTFSWVGNKTDIEQMIGNAVPVKLAEFVAKSLLAYIASDSQDSEKNNFEAWLIGTKNYSSRGAKDVISRCKRAERMVPSNGEDEAHYIFALEQSEEFHCLSVNVRSQIKRAIKLKTEYETS